MLMADITSSDKAGSSSGQLIGKVDPRLKPTASTALELAKGLARLHRGKNGANTMPQSTGQLPCERDRICGDEV